MSLRRILGASWPLLLLAALAGTLIALFHRPAAGPADSARGGAAAGQAGDSAPAAAVAPIRPDTRVVYQVHYRPCQTTEEQAGPAPPALVGLHEDDLRRVYPQWDVAEFSPDQVVLTRATDDLCTEYREWRHLRLVDHELVIFYGRRGTSLVKERTHITGEMLRPADRLMLRRGIDLPGDAAVRAFLESGP